MKLLLFIADTILYVENPTEFTKEKPTSLQKLSNNKTTSKQTKNELKKQFHAQRIKLLRNIFNKQSQDLYNQNHKTVLRESKGDK